MRSPGVGKCSVQWICIELKSENDSNVRVHRAKKSIKNDTPEPWMGRRASENPGYSCLVSDGVSSILQDSLRYDDKSWWDLSFLLIHPDPASCKIANFHMYSARMPWPIVIEGTLIRSRLWKLPKICFAFANRQWNENKEWNESIIGNIDNGKVMRSTCCEVETSPLLFR